MTRPDPPLDVDARGLVKTYKGGIEAVRGISLAIPAGTVFGLLGPNGAGKSTTVIPGPYTYSYGY